MVLKTTGVQIRLLYVLLFSLQLKFQTGDILSDGVYSIETIREYAKLVEPEGIILNEVIKGVKLEIELKKRRHRNKLAPYGRT